MPTISCYLYYSNHACRAVWFLFFFFPILLDLCNKCNTGFILLFCQSQGICSCCSSCTALADFCRLRNLSCHFFASPPPWFCVQPLLTLFMWTKWRIMKFYASYDNFLPLLPLFCVIYLSTNLLLSPTCRSQPGSTPCVTFGLHLRFPKSPFLRCPCYKTVFWCCLCRQTMPTHSWSALALSSCLLFPAPHVCAESVTSLHGKDVVASC